MNGALKFTYHSPQSTLPIPDFNGDKNDKGSNKTEPHFLTNSLMAENYLKTCYPRTIQTVIEEAIPYLFWVTRKQPGNNPQVIIGYLEVTGHEETPHTLTTKEGKTVLTGRPHHTLYGQGHLYHFEEGIPTKELFGRSLNRIDFSHRFRIERKLTEQLLKHFKPLENIVEACAEELRRLDGNGVTCIPDICSYTNQCNRFVPGYGTRISTNQEEAL